MTKLLENAIEQVQRLSSDEQDAIAAIILDEIADDRKWDETFARTQAQLSKIADKVREDIRSGKTRNMGIDEL
jgi:hypothetical protein